MYGLGVPGVVGCQLLIDAETCWSPAQHRAELFVIWLALCTQANDPYESL